MPDHNNLPRYSPEYVIQDLDHIITTYRAEGYTLGAISNLLRDAGYPPITRINHIPRI